MWGSLIAPIANIAGNWMDGKVEETKAKAAVKVAKAHAEAEISKRVAAGEIDIQRSQADATDGSWRTNFLALYLGFGFWETSRRFLTTIITTRISA